MRGMFLASCLVILLVPSSAAQAPSAFLPEQVHVTLGSDPGTLVVHWAVAAAAYTPAEAPIVEWSANGSSSSTAATHAGVVTAGALNLQAATRYDTHVYSATLGPFAPGTEVTYRAGSESRGFTPQFKTKMPPAINSTFRFVAYGDIGIDTTAADGSRDPTAAEHPAHDIQDLALSKEPQLVIIPGDLPYSNTREGWDAFMRFLEPLAATVPVMPVTGNHEWDETLGYAQYLNTFVLPNDELNYVFQAGPVTFIAVNSDNICQNHARGNVGSPPRPCNDGASGTLNDELTAWLEAALEQAANDETPWTVVYHHHPALSYGRHNIDWGVHTYWMPLYAQHKVDLVVNAHDHLYSRSYPANGRQPVMTGNEYPKGTAPIYVVLGGGGRELYSVPTEPGPAWHAYGEAVHHIGVFDVSPDALVFEAIRIDGTVMDRFTIFGASSTQEPSSAAIGAPGVWLLVGALVAAALTFRRRT
jgi:hypothetical protein